MHDAYLLKNTPLTERKATEYFKIQSPELLVQLCYKDFHNSFGGFEPPAPFITEKKTSCKVFINLTQSYCYQEKVCAEKAALSLEMFSQSNSSTWLLH